MKPFYTKATTDFDKSITIRYDERPNLYPHWHYHDEYELVYIHKSTGVRYVGGSVSPYKQGDLVLLGSKLPHTWINDVHKESSQLISAATILHLQPKFVHNEFFELPLMREIKKLLAMSGRGIHFNNVKGIEEILREILLSQSAKKVSIVIDLLHTLSQTQNINLLNKSEYSLPVSFNQSERLIKIHNYIIRNFRKNINLSTLAGIANMTPQAFCNYFKQRNRKTVFTYINELKIGHSCKMLIEKDLNIERIAFECGFNNTTFFNRKFKEIMCLTPKEYRKQFRFQNTF